MSRAGVALALVVATLVAVPSAAAGWPTFERALDAAALTPKEPLKAWTGKRPSLADVDLDGDLDLVAHNANQHVYAIDLATGKVLVEVKPRYPYGPDLGPFNGAASGDLDGDGVVELVSVNRAAVVSAWSLYPRNGTLDPVLRFDRHLNKLHGHPTADAAPALGDLDADGTLEIVVQTEERGTYALRHDGSILWALNETGGNAEVVLADVDGDDRLEAVIFTDGGAIVAVDGATGAPKWRFDAARKGIWPGSITTAGLVEDLDGDGIPEVVACLRNVENATVHHAPGAPKYRDHHFVLVSVRGGDLAWRAKPSWGYPLCSAYLMAHDADDDGKKEIYGMDWNTIGHKPGDWERLGDPHVFSFHADGRERWHASVNAFNAKPAIALADVDGDGAVEVVAYEEGGLVYLDAKTGARRGSTRLPSWSIQQGPLAHDGKLLVAVTGRSDAFAVVDAADGAAAPWPGWAPPPRSLRPPPPPTPAPPSPVSTATPPPTLPPAPTPATGPAPTPLTPVPGADEGPPDPRDEAPFAGVLLVVAALAVARLVRRR